ncbi:MULTISPECIES: trypsin-like peptidase domain-containing protein [Streptomyces]|uniref:trypsin-like peptidase domain-containing protein n=1 Tax=Streptomyces TaxID=1883 RepID=UPI0012FEC0F6|nr:MULTISPECIES: trypsin-like peptidase domain-containing protein [Streptomyces]
MADLIAAQQPLERVAMVVRRGSDGVPRFAASGFVLASRLAICAGHGFTHPGDSYEVRLPGQPTQRLPVTAVLRHRIDDVDLALLVLGEGGPVIPPARWGVLPRTVESVPFIAIGFPDHASRQDVPKTRQLTGAILLGSFLGSHEMELSLSSPAPLESSGSPWRGVSGAGVLTQDGVLVGVCTSHHVPSGAASLTATDLSQVSRDPEFVRLLAEHGVEPVPPGDIVPTPFDPAVRGRVRTHAEVIRRLLGRRSFLDEEHLPFIHPGMDHASHPDHLFAQLSTGRSRGALLVGPAGSGKTRTCFEVAHRADRAGWQVLHVQPDSAVTVDDVAASVVSCGRRRVLLVLDYLDACPQVDLRVLADVLIPEAKRRGVTVACLASVRPGSLSTVQLRGSSRVLDEIYVREDWPHQSAIIDQVVHRAAPETVRRWGNEALSQICGRRPVIALLIARAIEEQGLAQHTPGVAASVRPGELLDWLREGMRRDALATGPALSPSPLGITTPAIEQLAFTVAVAASPQSRMVVEQTIDTFLTLAGGLAVPFGGRRVVDTLISLGWLDEVGGQLIVVHDIVTDELLLQSLMPSPGWSIDAAAAGALFAAFTRHARTFSVFTGHLRRLAVDMAAHGPAHRIAALERYCGEWLTAQVDPLGHLLAGAGDDGGQALLTMVTSRPWQGFDRSVWNTLVGPWLSRAEADHTAQPFLTAALRGMDPAPSFLVEASVGWLVRRGGQTDTEHLLLALIERPDLSPSTEDLVVDCTLAWVSSRPDWRHTPALWKRLLGMDHSRDRLERVVAGVLAWLTPYRSVGVAPVMRMFLQRADIDAVARRKLVDHGLVWLRSDLRPAVNIGPELCALLEDHHLPDPDRATLIRSALDWLETGQMYPSTGRVVHRLLSTDGCPPELRPRVIAVARWWAAEGPAGNPAGSRVLGTLLSTDSVADSAALLLERLRSQPDAQSGPAILLRLLIHYEELTQDQARTAVTLAFTWLDSRPDHEAVGSVLGALLRVPDLPSAQLQRAIRLGCAALLARPDDHVLMAVMLSQLRGLTRDQARSIADVSLQWLACHGGKVQRPVLASFLTRTDLSVVQAHIGIDIALDRLSTDRSMKSRSVLSGVLRHPALDEDRRSRAVDNALNWLEAHGTGPKVCLVIEDLLSLPALSPSQRVHVMRLAAGWLARHGDLPYADRLRSALDAETRRHASREEPSADSGLSARR